MERKIIKASDGMVLTNGTIFGKTIYLAEGLNESDFHEITREEYGKLTEGEGPGVIDVE